ncbi:MAG: hypothetical protein AB4040_08855 [Synechococcus sp.]
MSKSKHYPIGSHRSVRGWRSCLDCAGLVLLAIASGCALNSANVSTNIDESVAETETEDREMAEPETVELPIESIQLKSDRLSLQASLEATAVVVLPDSCHQFARLEGTVDANNRIVKLMALGRREGDFCAQVLGMEEAILRLDPLPNSGLWTISAPYYGDTIEVQFTVTD